MLRSGVASHRSETAEMTADALSDAAPRKNASALRVTPSGRLEGLAARGAKYRPSRFEDVLDGTRFKLALFHLPYLAGTQMVEAGRHVAVLAREAIRVGWRAAGRAREAGGAEGRVLGPGLRAAVERELVADRAQRVGMQQAADGRAAEADRVSVSAGLGLVLAAARTMLPGTQARQASGAPPAGMQLPPLQALAELRSIGLPAASKAYVKRDRVPAAAVLRSR